MGCQRNKLRLTRGEITNLKTYDGRPDNGKPTFLLNSGFSKWKKNYQIKNTQSSKEREYNNRGIFVVAGYFFKIGHLYHPKRLFISLSLPILRNSSCFISNERREQMFAVTCYSFFLTFLQHIRCKTYFG